MLTEQFVIRGSKRKCQKNAYEIRTPGLESVTEEMEVKNSP
jgi:hypothetical protein